MDGVNASSVGDVHVMPDFGKEHQDSSECWCRPSPDPATLDRAKHDHTVWIHEVQQ